MFRTINLFAACLFACFTGPVFAQAVLPLHPVHVIAGVTLGDGIISPYKMMELPGSEGKRLLVVTGLGESFGISVLHELNAENLQDQRPPLGLCSNVSAMAPAGNDAVVIACRSSRELVEVNLDSWEIVARLQVNFAAIALASVSADCIVVTSVNSGDVELIQVEGQSLRIIRHVSLRQNSYAVVADPQNQLIYVVQPNFGIVALHSNDLSISQEYPTAGTPSFGVVVWRHKLLFTDRDGYLRILDPVTGRIQAVGLAAILGLDRKALPPRGIDPTDVISVGGGNFLVVSSRQNSVILTLTGQFPFDVKLAHQVPSGAYSMYAASSSTAYITQPTGNKIVHFQVGANIQSSQSLQIVRTVVGRQLVYATRYRVDNAPAIAAIDSQNNLFTVSDAGTLMVRRLSPPHFVPIGPLVRGPDDSILVIGNFRGIHVLGQVSSGGVLQRYINVGNLWPVFSIRRTNNQVLLVDRLSAKIGVLNLDTWEMQLFNTDRSRPRTGLLLPDNRLILIHDTNPDIGYALWADGRMQEFISTHRIGHNFSSYPTDIVSCDAGRSAVISFFGNDIIRIDTRSGEILDHAKLPDGKTMQLSACCDEGVWAVSPDFDRADLVDLRNGLQVMDRIQIQGLDYIFPFGLDPECESGLYARHWAVTDTKVMLFSLLPPGKTRQGAQACHAERDHIMQTSSSGAGQSVHENDTITVMGS